MGNVVSLLCLRILVVELNKREDKNADDHGGAAGVVGISGGYEAVVLRVLERADRHLRGAEEIGVAEAPVLDVELEDAVDVGDAEGGGERGSRAGGREAGANVGVEHDELELDVRGLEGRPFAVHALLDLDGVLLEKERERKGYFILFFSIKQIDECHICQDQSQKFNYLRDPLPADRFIHLFNKNILLFKQKK